MWYNWCIILVYEWFDLLWRLRDILYIVFDWLITWVLCECYIIKHRTQLSVKRPPAASVRKTLAKCPIATPLLRSVYTYHHSVLHRHRQSLTLRQWWWLHPWYTVTLLNGHMARVNEALRLSFFNGKNSDTLTSSVRVHLYWKSESDIASIRFI